MPINFIMAKVFKSKFKTKVDEKSLICFYYFLFAFIPFNFVCKSILSTNFEFWYHNRYSNESSNLIQYSITALQKVKIL